MLAVASPASHAAGDSLSSLLGGLALIGLLVGIMLLAIRGSRPGTTSGQRKARTMANVRHYNLSIRWESLATGWAVGEIAHASHVPFVAAVVVGIVTGLAYGALGAPVAAVLGLLGLAIMIGEIVSDPIFSPADRSMVFGALTLALLIAWIAGVVGLFALRRNPFATLAVVAMLLADIVKFTADIGAPADLGTSLRLFLALAFVVLPFAAVLAVLAPTFVPSMFAVGLLIAEFWTIDVLGRATSRGTLFVATVMVLHSAASRLSNARDTSHG